MSWLRLEDGFPNHPKFDGWTTAQKWAFLELLAYCARFRTGGFVPAVALLPRVVNSRLLKLAESSGLLERDAEGELVVHDWEQYNPSDATAAERMRRYRERRADRNANRNGAVTETVTSRARPPARDAAAPRRDSHTPVREEVKTTSSLTPPRQRDELWDILAEELGEPATKSERGRRNTALKELRDIGATPDDLRRRVRSYRHRWPEVELTATAVAANWSLLDRGPQEPLSKAEKVQRRIAQEEAKAR